MRLTGIIADAARSTVTWPLGRIAPAGSAIAAAAVPRRETSGPTRYQVDR